MREHVRVWDTIIDEDIKTDHSLSSRESQASGGDSRTNKTSLIFTADAQESADEETESRRDCATVKSMKYVHQSLSDTRVFVLTDCRWPSHRDPGPEP